MNDDKPVYVCGDEPELALAIETELRGRYAVVLSETGAEAMIAARAGRARLLVMDRMQAPCVPSTTAWRACRRRR